MFLVLPLIPDRSPTINLFPRTDDDDLPSTTPTNGSPIPGVAVTNRTGHYRFDITAIPDGMYVVVVADPIGTYYIKKHNGELLVNDYWSTFEQVRISLSPQAFSNMTAGISSRNRLVFYNDEQVTISITRTDGEDFDGSLMDFVVELENKTALVEVLGVSSVTNTVAVTIPSTPYNETPGKRWSLRVASTGQVLLNGPATMNYAPLKDPP